MIYHLALAADWDAALVAGEYRVSTRGRSLEDEGFIHASTEAQVPGTYERFYRDAGEVVLLSIDEALLSAPVVVEQLGEAPEAFPHVYGPVPVAAVVEVRAYP